MKRILLVLFTAFSGVAVSPAQQPASEPSAFSVVTNPLNSNWYVQAGLDMSLQNPYGYDFKDVFPNGKTFGLDVAIGRWFTPGLGVRAKVNWENGPLLENKSAYWLYGPDRIPDHRAGYFSVCGDVLFNIHNLFIGYDRERFWNIYVFPRAGMVYNTAVSKGSPLLGLGMGNTFRLNERLGIYFDLAYQMVSSGFVGVLKNTGTGTNSNGYFDFNVGLQINLGRSAFTKASEWNGGQSASQAQSAADGTHSKSSVQTNSFWSNWFLQGGIDMSLQNPYGYNFSHVFPNGKTFGINVAVGKWFSPEIGLRAKINWENGIIKNNNLTWVAPQGTNINYEKGGYFTFCGEVLFNIHSLICGYDETRFWNTILHPRAGIANNRATDSASPLVGCGIENTFRLSDKLSLYADFAYQVTTSEFFGGESTTGMSVSSGSNGFFDINLGVIFYLGKSKNKFLRPNERAW